MAKFKLAPSICTATEWIFQQLGYFCVGNQQGRSNGFPTSLGVQKETHWGAVHRITDGFAEFDGYVSWFPMWITGFSVPELSIMLPVVS